MQFVQINGVTIHYKWIDHKKDKTFLFINSLGTDFRIWENVAALVKDYGNILLFDKRGHGLSDTVENTKGLSDFTADAMALLQFLSIKKCIPVGLSVGGMIAQLLAVTVPEKIEKLILCNTRHKIGNEQIWNDRIAAVTANGLSSIADAVMQRWFSSEFINENEVKITGYKNMLQRMPAAGYIKTCQAIRDADLTELASKIKTPVLCVAGSQDKSTLPEEVKGLAGLIEGAMFTVIEGSGHIPCADNPSALSKLIIDFVK